MTTKTYLKPFIHLGVEIDLNTEASTEAAAAALNAKMDGSTVARALIDDSDNFLIGVYRVRDNKRLFNLRGRSTVISYVTTSSPEWDDETVAIYRDGNPVTDTVYTDEIGGNMLDTTVHPDGTVELCVWETEEGEPTMGHSVAMSTDDCLRLTTAMVSFVSNALNVRTPLPEIEEHTSAGLYVDPDAGTELALTTAPHDEVVAVCINVPASPGVGLYVDLPRENVRELIAALQATLAYGEGAK